jgi:catechol 2,3-dioxygenase-like lactoylglutathione lyase family enzyme
MIRVKNEEKSIRFYCELLGLKKGARIRLEDCYLQYLIDEKTGTEIELTINDEIPTDDDFEKSIGDYLTFEFSMIMQNREYLFKEGDDSEEN